MTFSQKCYLISQKNGKNWLTVTDFSIVICIGCVCTLKVKNFEIDPIFAKNVIQKKTDQRGIGLTLKYTSSWVEVNLYRNLENEMYTISKIIVWFL